MPFLKEEGENSEREKGEHAGFTPISMPERENPEIRGMKLMSGKIRETDKKNHSNWGREEERERWRSLFYSSPNIYTKQGGDERTDTAIEKGERRISGYRVLGSQAERPVRAP